MAATKRVAQGLVAVALFGCGGRAEVPPDESDAPAVVIEARDPVAMAEAVQRLLRGEYLYEDESCFFVDPDAATRHLFSCGRIAAGPTSEASDAVVESAVALVDGALVRRLGRPPWATLILEVPVGSEREALESLFGSGAFESVELVWGGGVATR
ncbi:MAG: hypothetical protein ABL963_10930 [Longimicrobiales bacterium]